MKSSSIVIHVEGEDILLESPLNRAANADYRSLGGRWDAPRRAWRFAARDLDRVRKVLRKHFGHDDQPYTAVDTRVDMGSAGVSSEWSRSLWMFGRNILTRIGRDYPVWLGEDVILAEGEFMYSAGSRNNPVIGDMDGVILEVRGVPADHPDLAISGVTVLSTPELASTARVALETERAALVARLAEINTQLTDKE